MISIRPRKPDDLDGCIEVLARVHAADGYPAAWPGDPGRWLTPSHLLGAWVAERTSALVGHVGLSGASPGPSAEYWSASSRVAQQPLSQAVAVGGGRDEELPHGA